MEKIKLVKKIMKEKLFADSIRFDDPNEKIDSDNISVINLFFAFKHIQRYHLLTLAQS